MALRGTTSRTELGVLLKREAQCLLAPVDVATVKIDDTDQELLNRLVRRFGPVRPGPIRSPLRTELAPILPQE